MKIAIISLGDELLRGATINTNAAFIASHLQANGLSPSIHLTLPDAEEPITEYFNLLISQYDLILVTGGLGPTKDDITKTIISKIFNYELAYTPEIAEYLTKKYPKLSISLESQASIPTGAKYFLNSFGTAPGFILEKHSCFAAFMPGVPSEMQPMLTSQILPYILSIKKFNNLTPVFSRTLVLFKIFETKINDFLVDLQNIYPNFSFGLYPDLGILKVVLYANSAAVNASAEQEITIITNKMRQEFADYFLNTNNSNLAEVIAGHLTKNKLTLALAESITGGALAARFTAIPGASNFLLGSIVSYSAQAKIAYLDINQANLAKYSAVSPEISYAMATNIKHKLTADFAIAVTGYAGPDGGTEQSPVGTAYVSIIGNNQHYSYTITSNNKTRSAVITRTCNLILAEFLQLLDLS